MEAAILLAKCSSNKKMFGIRIEKNAYEDSWVETWAFPIDERRAKAEGYTGTQIDAGLFTGESYPGCPYCGSNGLVFCDLCHKPTCWKGEKKLTCQWCGNLMDNISPAERFQFSTGDDL